MLIAADAALVARDPALPGLPVLLDDDLLAEFVGRPVGRRYLRYKHGTSCVLGGVVELPDGPAEVFVTAYGAAGTAKLHKTVKARPPASVLVTDPDRGLLAGLATADRDLPFLALLADAARLQRVLRAVLPDSAGWDGTSWTTLSYKPQRRWVGLLESAGGRRVVLRAYRPADVIAAEHAVRALQELPPRTPRLLGVDRALGLLVLEYVEGRTADRLPASSAGSGKSLGTALARLHSCPPGLLALQSPAEGADALRAAAEQVGVLLPEFGPAAQELAGALSRRLMALSPDRVVIHGDFSRDQVLIGADGEVTLLDLDRAGEGDPAFDLASLSASLAAQDVLGAAGPARYAAELMTQVRAGYAAARALPREEAVVVHTAALLLRRAAEPFRLCLPDWADRVRAMLVAATEASRLDDPLAQAPDDLVAPVLGSPLSWEVLKDKPGRRRTSRAAGPRGTAIVKVYASGRAAVVAARVQSLRDGPPEPAVPQLLACHSERHLVVLSEVPGEPFRTALLGGDLAAAARVGGALAGWHQAFRGYVPTELRAHTGEREVEILLRRCHSTSPELAQAVRSAVPALSGSWPTDTVVHRDLYEDQIVLGPIVGLVDLDDAACGPAELDIGNLLAHLVLLTRRTGQPLDAAVSALLRAYQEVAPLDAALLTRCRALSLLRLACAHGDPGLVPQPGATGTSRDSPQAVVTP